MSFPISDIAARFAHGRSYEQYLAHMQKNRETIEAITQRIQLSADDEQFARNIHRALGTPIYTLVISEDWCPDCALNIPTLMKIAALNPAFVVRFLGRDDNLDILEFARKGERKAIPTIFFFDADWNEIGHWVERPLRVDALLAAWDRTHPAPTEPDRTHEVWRKYRQARSAYREELFFQHAAWRDTIDELRRILSREMVSNVMAMTATM